MQKELYKFDCVYILDECMTTYFSETIHYFPHVNASLLKTTAFICLQLCAN